MPPPSPQTPESAPAAVRVEPPAGFWHRRGRRWLVELLLIVAILGAMQVWQTRHMRTGQAPDAVLVRAGMASSPSTLGAWRASHRGEAVVLYFWATWCPVCKAEEPLMDGLIQRFPVLPIALQSGSAADVARFESRQGLRWQSVADADGGLARLYGVQATPSFVIIGPDGRIVSRTVGLTSPWGLRLRLWWARLASL